MHPAARRQRLEVILGFLGFFTAIALINAVVLLARGTAGIVPSLVLLGFVILFALALRSWRAQRTPAAPPRNR
jgi:hypothetical protein